jgi:hypothetical protein
MKNGFSGIVGFERCDDKSAAPSNKEQEDHGPTN